MAAASGVSVTTVSHALNGKGRVDAATRARVAEVARRLGYRANRSARSLRSGRTATLALLIPTIGADPHDNEALGLDYYMRLVNGAVRAAYVRDHSLMMLPAVRDADEVRDLPVDGAIVADPSADDPVVALFDAVGTPVVTIGGLDRDDDPWRLSSANGPNTRMVLDHLAERGARRIALMAPDISWSWAAETVRAYQTWTREHRRPNLVERVPLTRLEGSAHDAAARLLADPERPDAIFALAERYATGVLRACAEHGLNVPGDVLVAAGSDSTQASAGHPPVTALDLRPEEHAAQAVDLLIARIEGAAARHTGPLPAQLNIRASTGES